MERVDGVVQMGGHIRSVVCLKINVRVGERELLPTLEKENIRQ